jgi:hypothetical protein
MVINTYHSYRMVSIATDRSEWKHQRGYCKPEGAFALFLQLLVLLSPQPSQPLSHKALWLCAGHRFIHDTAEDPKAAFGSLLAIIPRVCDG